MASPVAVTLAKPTNVPAEAMDYGPNRWTIYDTETNAAVAATLAGVDGQQHFLREIIVSFSAVPAAACTLEIKSGSTVLLPIQIGVAAAGPVVVEFPKAGLQCAIGAALSLELSSPGNVTASVVGIGFTAPDATTYAAS